MRTGRLILYRDFEGSRLLRDMVWLMENYEDEFYEQEDVAGLLYDCIDVYKRQPAYHVRASGADAEGAYAGMAQTGEKIHAVAQI